MLLICAAVMLPNWSVVNATKPAEPMAANCPVLSWHEMEGLNRTELCRVANYKEAMRLCTLANTKEEDV